jgi:hypothetical protein
MKYRYLTIDEDGRLYGFNDAGFIKELAQWQAVWDLETGEVHATWDQAEPGKMAIREFRPG